MDQGLSLRPATSEDEPFLCQVYASTRLEELEPVPWDAAQKDAFLQWQCALQQKHYCDNYPGAVYQVVLYQGQPAGRLYLHRREKEIRIMDIALLPEHRRRGLGTSLLRDILAEGQARGVTVTIHVEQFNPALHLYERLGFRHIADHGPYYLMEWLPDA